MNLIEAVDLSKVYPVEGCGDCHHLGSCGDCTSTSSICTYVIETRLSKPAGRIKVILVGESLGF
jgi:hypothetical protein